MDRNIYRPGAGHQPPLLVARETEIAAWHRMLNEIDFSGRGGGRDTVLSGPRGVGKTVLLGRCATIAEKTGYEVLQYQAVPGNVGLVRALAARAADRLDEQLPIWTKARRAFENVAGVELGAAGLSAKLSLRQAPDRGFTRDPSDIATALATLAAEVRKERPNGGVMLAVDELQTATKPDLTLLAGTLHRLNVEHPEARVAFRATGLPNTHAVMRRAGVTHPDRLFPLAPLPTILPRDAAGAAIVEPAHDAGVAWEPAAVDLIVSESGGYPAHVQLMAARTWDSSPGPDRILLADAEHGVAEAMRELQAGTFADTYDSLTTGQLSYASALAELGGRAASSAVAEKLRSRTTDLSQFQADLKRAGVLYSPRHGVVAFTAPAMAEYVRAKSASAD